MFLLRNAFRAAPTPEDMAETEMACNGVARSLFRFSQPASSAETGNAHRAGSAGDARQRV